LILNEVLRRGLVVEIEVEREEEEDSEEVEERS
jgi:hypothetical protein